MQGFIYAHTAEIDTYPKSVITIRPAHARRPDENASAVTARFREYVQRIYVARYAGFGLDRTAYPQLALWATLYRQLRWLGSCFHPVRTLEAETETEFSRKCTGDHRAAGIDVTDGLHEGILCRVSGEVVYVAIEVVTEIGAVGQVEELGQ